MSTNLHIRTSLIIGKIKGMDRNLKKNLGKYDEGPCDEATALASRFAAYVSLGLAMSMKSVDSVSPLLLY